MSSAPGRRELRWFGCCAALAALFNLSNALVTVRVQADLLLLGSRLNLFFGGLHTAAWFQYTAAQSRRRLTKLEYAFVVGGIVLSFLALVPGVVLADHLFTRRVPWLDVTYADAPPTPFGLAVYAYHALGLLWLLAHFVKRRLRGDREMTAQCIALFAILLAIVHDALESTGLIGGPYFLDIALFVMILAVGGSLTSSFVANARALEVSSRNLARAQEQLVKRERLAALGELAAVVAHEVRNPLAVVFNATAGLRRAMPGSPDHQALVGIVQEEAEHLRDIVSDLLEFARPRPPLFALTALDEVVKAAVDAARGETHAVSSDVLVEVENGGTQTSCDERLVRQAVINLVTNALHAPDRRGPVRVHVGSEPAYDGHDERVFIRVSDDGRGIAADLHERIFTPFYTTRPSGTGLGLAIVRSSAEAHGGDVLVASKPGSGTAFTLRLPRNPR